MPALTTPTTAAIAKTATIRIHQATKIDEDTDGDNDNGKEEEKDRSSYLRPRKLISQYLAKTCPPPAMFKPTFNVIEMNPQIELAYKHPIFLLENQQQEPIFSSNNSIKTDVESIMHEKNKEVEIVEIKYIDDDDDQFRAGEAIKCVVRQQQVSDASSLTSSYDCSTNNRKNLFNDANKSTVGVDANQMCHLVGKINPNIIKTWEQLSGNTLKTKTSTTTTTTLAGKTETNCILFHRKTFEMDGKMGTPIPQTLAIEQQVPSENFFFDSIDGATSLLSSVDIDDYDVTCNEKYIISCRNYDHAMDSMMMMTSVGGRNGGEGMAELDSLERTQMQWSLDK
jgi:hypothetical protein